MKNIVRHGAITLLLLAVGCNSTTENEQVSKADQEHVSEEKAVGKNQVDDFNEEIPLVEHGTLIDGALVCIPEDMNDSLVLDFDTQAYLEGDRLKVLLDSITSGGPPPDGIPAIEEAKYMEMIDAEEILNDDDVVFVLELGHETYIFPQRIIVWHEIVNLENEGIALTYCPLTGSAISYEYPSGYETSFGTSGSLLNSNLVMYDRATDSYISQLDGIGLDGELKGVELNSVPTFWTSWGQAKQNYVSAQVLSEETGHRRNYRDDPYGSYTQAKSNNYYEEDFFMFQPLNLDEDKVFFSKKQIVGIKAGDERMALDPSFVEEQGKVTFELAGETHLAVYDSNLDNVRVYIEKAGQQVNAEYYNVMWFAWYGLYPETEIIK